MPDENVPHENKNEPRQPTEAKPGQAKRTDFGTYQLDVAEPTTYVVGTSNGELIFDTDKEGRYTPTSAEEVTALKDLGAKEVK